LKILQVVHFFPPHSIGGSELYTRDLARALSVDHEVHLFFTIPESKNEAPTRTGQSDGIPCCALQKNYATYDRPFHECDRRVDREFERLLDRFRPDLIHFQHLMNLSLRLPGIAKRRGIACCYTLHDFWLLCPSAFLLRPDFGLCAGSSALSCLGCMEPQIGYYGIRPDAGGFLGMARQGIKQVLNFNKKLLHLFALAVWRKYWMRSIMHAVDIFIAPSRFLQQQYVRCGLDAQKIIFLRHGFSKQDYKGSIKKPARHLRFAFIGSPREYKGIYTLIDAFNLITKPCELRIYGALSPRMLQELTARSRNPNMHCMGTLAEENKKDAFANIDVLIVPSLCYENCPLVIHEAFMAKIPVIATAHGGMAELVRDGVDGCTFPAGRPEGLAAKMRLFLDDLGLKDRLAANIPEVKDMKVHAQELVSIYNRVLSRKN